MNYDEALKYLNNYVKQEIKEIMSKEIFKVGDSVYCALFGWGVVFNIDESADYPICVDFKNNSNISYTFDGRYYENAKRTLSFSEYIFENFSQERPIVLPKVGELCLVRDTDDNTWLVREFTEYRHGLFICKAVHGQCELEWKYMKRIKILD
jgi:hypothetical protein